MKKGMAENEYPGAALRSAVEKWAMQRRKMSSIDEVSSQEGHMY
jgi:hypothetical protein